jgi:polar amino acid transport system substrate-binding protein
MALAITALAAVMSLAHADALDDIKKAGKIRIAIDLGVPPYGMTDDSCNRPASTSRRHGCSPRLGLEFEHVPTTGASDSCTSDRQSRPRDLEPLLHGRAREGHRFFVRLCRAANGNRAPKSVALKSLADLDGKTVGRCAARRTTRS